MKILPYNKRKSKHVMSPLVEKYINEISKKYSKNFNIKSKKNPSGLYYIVRPILKIFNKDIDEKFITVLFGTVWVPENFLNNDEMNVLEVIAHETVHEADRKRLGTILFTITYLFPQILCLGSLLSVLAIWFGNGFLWSLLCLLFLLPIPALGRAYLELRGYRMNVLFMTQADKVSLSSLEPYLYYIATNFTSANYYFMMPFKNFIINKLKLDPFSQNNNEIYIETLDWLKKEGKI